MTDTRTDSYDCRITARAGSYPECSEQLFVAADRIDKLHIELSALKSIQSRDVGEIGRLERELAALEAKRREDVRKCENYARLFFVSCKDLNPNGAADAIRAEFPECFHD